jgi:FkbM family methyltransferase
MSTANFWNSKKLIKRAVSVQPLNFVATHALRAALPPHMTWRLPVAQREVPVRVAGESFVMTDPSRCLIAKELFWGRGERIQPDERLCLALFVALSRQASCVLDIGANSGLFSLAAARANPRARVLAFEIVPDLFHLLVRNVLRNNVASSVDCRLRGVGAPGFSMTVPASFNESSLPTSVSSLDHYDDGVRIAFESLDRLCADLEEGERVLIKIDVEGTEDAVLGHGARVLRELQPDVVCELLPAANTAAAVTQALSVAPYRFYKICGDALVRHDRLEPDARFHDWLFTVRSEQDLRAALPPEIALR